MQMFSISLRPVVRHQLPRTPVGGNQPVSDGVEIDGGERPALERERSVVEVARQPIARVVGKAGLFGCLLDVGQPLLDRRHRRR
jgi:hypothetical protein